MTFPFCSPLSDSAIAGCRRGEEASGEMSSAWCADLLQCVNGRSSSLRQLIRAASQLANLCDWCRVFDLRCYGGNVSCAASSGAYALQICKRLCNPAKDYKMPAAGSQRKGNSSRDNGSSKSQAARSSGDFADSFAVFAAPKRIGLRSHIRLSGVLVKSSSITSSDVSTYVRHG